MAAFYYRTLFVYLVVHAYLFVHLWLYFNKKRAFLLTLPLFAGMAVFPVLFLHLPEDGFLQNALSLVAQFWLPVAFFCLIIFVVFDFFRVARFCLTRLFPRRSFRLPGFTPIVSLCLIICAAVYGYGLNEARALHVTRLELPTAKLPKGTERLRLVFASDLHISPHTGRGMLRQTIDCILAENPDCIVLGGDLLDDSRQGTGLDMAELQRLKAPLGVYGVLGNHDAFGNIQDSENFLRRAGITMLSSQEVDTGPLCIIGMDDPLAAAQRPAPLPGAVSLLQKADHSRYTILLDHRPKVRPKSIGLFDLQLSGHTHGGQILPFKPYMRSKYGMNAGLSRYHAGGAESLLFLTTGVGFSKLPIRLDAPPEIVVIDLVRE